MKDHSKTPRLFSLSFSADAAMHERAKMREEGTVKLCKTNFLFLVDPWGKKGGRERRAGVKRPPGLGGRGRGGEGTGSRGKLCSPKIQHVAEPTLRLPLQRACLSPSLLLGPRCPVPTHAAPLLSLVGLAAICPSPSSLTPVASVCLPVPLAFSCRRGAACPPGPALPWSIQFVFPKPLYDLWERSLPSLGSAWPLPPVRPRPRRPPDGISASSFFANADKTGREIGPVH